MTIVIQHTFWDLKVNEAGFEVDLTFNDVRERLAIPFAAVQAFFDPSVKFGLQFDVAMESLEEEAEDLPDEATPDISPADGATAQKSGEAAADHPGEVVSLDAFRKKK